MEFEFKIRLSDVAIAVIAVTGAIIVTTYFHKRG